MERIVLEIFHPYTKTPERIVASSRCIVIGRGYHCDVILDDPYVSEEHLEVALSEDGSFLLTDKGSVNGVHIGAKKISDFPAHLESGHDIKIGKTKIRIFSPRHTVLPTQPHNTISSILHACDKPVIGVLISVMAAIFVICASARVESGDVDFWTDSAPGVGMGFLLFVIIVWSAIHMVLVIKDKKFMPWSRIVSYLSVVAVIVVIFDLLIVPYFEFYLSPMLMMALTAISLFTCAAFFEHCFCIVCELPKKPVKSLFLPALAFALFMTLINLDFDYSYYPIFPSTIISSDLPLPHVQPLDVFIDQVLVESTK